MNSTTLRSNESMRVTLLIQNVLPIRNNVTAENSWTYPTLLNFGAPTLKCPLSYSLIFEGNYDNNNVSSAQNPLYLSPTFVSYPALVLKELTIDPSSTNATVEAQIAGILTSYRSSLKLEASVNGSYDTPQPRACADLPPHKLMPFQTGSYTFIAGDEWNQTTILHFNVIND